MLSPLFLFTVESLNLKRIVRRLSNFDISTYAIVQVVLFGILGLICHGVSFWALTGYLAFEHVLLFGGSFAFGVLLLPFPAGFGPREWFFMQFMGGFVSPSVLIAFVTHRMLQMIVEILFALFIQVKQLSIRWKSLRRAES